MCEFKMTISSGQFALLQLLCNNKNKMLHFVIHTLTNFITQPTVSVCMCVCCHGDSYSGFIEEAAAEDES